MTGINQIENVGEVMIREKENQPMTSVQPIAQPKMELNNSYLINSRNSKGLILNFEGKREWNNSLFDFKDRFGFCVFAWFCQPLVFGQTHSRLEYLEKHNKPHPDKGEKWGTMTWITCCSDQAAWMLQLRQRQKIRERYSIVGTGTSDCWQVSCCNSCASVQEMREIEAEENFLRDNPEEVVV